MDLDHLVGTAEIAQRLGLRSTTTVNQWSRRHSDFPRPVKVLSAGRFWDWREIEVWVRRTGRLQ